MKIEHLVRPSSVAEAFRIVTETPGAVVFGGGAWNGLTLKSVGTAVLLDDVGLDTITHEDAILRIGATVPLEAVADDPVAAGLYSGILAQACRGVMGIGVRDLATIGGTVMGAYAFSDLLTVLLALDATLVFHRHAPLPLARFLAEKPASRDILVAVELPVREGRGVFWRFARTALDFATLNLAVTDSDGRYAIAVGARPGVAHLAEAAANLLNDGRVVTLPDLDLAAEAAVAELDFGTNGRASAAYRRALALAHLRRALREVTRLADPV